MTVYVFRWKCKKRVSFHQNLFFTTSQASVRQSSSGFLINNFNSSSTFRHISRPYREKEPIQRTKPIRRKKWETIAKPKANIRAKMSRRSIEVLCERWRLVLSELRRNSMQYSYMLVRKSSWWNVHVLGLDYKLSLGKMRTVSIKNWREWKMSMQKQFFSIKFNVRALLLEKEKSRRKAKLVFFSG